MLKKIVIIGPESTGKSTLCKQLAKHFNSSCVPEFAREFLQINGAKYDYEDIIIIAEGQLKAEADECNKQSGLNAVSIFIDTDLTVIRIWSEFVFNKCDNKILTEIAKRSYDLYLLCDIDQPWVKDELREYPDIESRLKLYQYYKETMISQGVPWVEITGSYNERLEKAIIACKKIIRVT
ncbi:MAG: ATP-binding protein [Ferruginibacter sp.]